MIGPFDDSKLNRDPIPTAPARIGDIHAPSYPQFGQITLPPPTVPAEFTPTLILPFKILTQAKPGSSPTSYQKGVIFDSLLMGTLSYSSIETISGLLASPAPDPTDAGWTDIKAGGGDLVWLKVGFTSWPTPNSFAIESLGDGKTFDGGEIEHDGGSGTPTIYTQTFARVVIGIVNFDGSGNIAIDQRLNVHRKLVNGAFTGNASDGSTPIILAALAIEPI